MDVWPDNGQGVARGAQAPWAATSKQAIARPILIAELSINRPLALQHGGAYAAAPQRVRGTPNEFGS